MTSLGLNIPSIKTKINGLRAQLEQEMAKKKSTENGQCNDELYSSKWIYYNKLTFLAPNIGTSNSTDTLKRINLKEDGNEKEVGGTPIAKRKTPEETKLDLLQQCTEAVIANVNTKTPLPNESATTNMSAFSLYAKTVLSQFDKRDRRIAEKRISDILFEIEMLADMPANGELNRQQRNPYSGFNFGIHQQGQQGSYDIQGQSYMDMLCK